MPRRSLQEELQQSKPFETPADEAVVALMRTAALVRRAMARRVETFGISVPQYNVLRILRGAGPYGLPTLAVRDRLIEEAPGITRLIDKLEEAGLVSRKRASDRRVVPCVITAKGLRLLAEMDPVLHEVSAELTKGLADPAQQRQLIALLGDLRAGLDEAR